MTKLNSFSRLKVKRDTFFIPDPKGGVFFRNNVSSFSMEGSTIYQWIEKLMPMFNGERTLGELTEGLTAPYRNRVYEIGETLYTNGFVRDVSQDRTHQLKPIVLEKYASQIEFIENFTDSGAYRFQEYRQAKVLAVGSGPFMVSLASALIESGLPKFQFMVTDSLPVNLQRMDEMIQNIAAVDSEVEIKQVPYKNEISFWQEAVKPYDWILYVSQDGNVTELKELSLVCKEQRRAFIPAIFLEHFGLAGPLVHPDSDECWESAWRRIHQSALQSNQPPQSYSSTAGAILANVLVFEFFKKAAGITDSSQSNQIYKLNLETLEGDWMSFIPHPLSENKSVSASLVEDLDIRMKQNDKESNYDLLDYFNRLTSKETGILHTWEERNLKQLPLSQSYVQAVNPLSEGPADLLPEVICSGLTHEEAKIEAGLTGLEMYVSQLEKRNRVTEGFLGIGAGGTTEEAVCRGLQAFLEEKLKNRKVDSHTSNVRVSLEKIEDGHCRYYLQALTTINGTPAVGLENDIFGFPVMWVKTHGYRYASPGLSTTLALRKALQQALMDIQNNTAPSGRVKESTVYLKEREITIEIPASESHTYLELLQSSIEILKQNNKQLVVYDLTFEPFLRQELAGAFGVQVREGDS